MQISQNHIIGQLYLNVSLPGTEAEGLALQQRLSNIDDSWFDSPIGKVLDKYPVPGILSIDRLEIDAGVIAIERFEKDLMDIVARALEKAIRMPDELSKASHNVQRKTEQESVFEAFIYFLENGRLPWSFRLPENVTLEQWVVHYVGQQPAESDFPHFKSSDYHVLSQLLSHADVALQRLLWQFSENFLHTILLQLSPQRQKIVQSVLLKLRDAIVDSPERAIVEEKLWQTAFSITSETFTNTTQLLTQALPKVSKDINATTFSSLVIQVKTIWPELTSVTELVTGTGADLPVSKETKEPIPEKTNVNVAILKNKLNSPPEKEDVSVKEGFYINNAGLVLLHPFLPMFFKNLGIAIDEGLLQPHRALTLLHFLVFGQTPAPEYELTLAKIICNIRVQAPVTSNVSLSEEEKNEAVALLEAVIRHWEALRSTSPDGLRGSFLIRPGKLSMKDDGDWLLQVESNAFDILLDDLPWGLSIIKLPWMQQMLWVEWR